MITAEHIEDYVRRQLTEGNYKRKPDGLTAKIQVKWALDMFRILSPALEGADNETIEEIKQRLEGM